MSNMQLWAAITIVEIVMVVCFNILSFKLTKIENKIDSLIKEKKHNETDCSVGRNENRIV